jgi:hypothetical protein
MLFNSSILPECKLFYLYVCAYVLFKVAEFIYNYKIQVSSVGIVTRLWAGWPRNYALAETRDFSLLQIIQDWLWGPLSFLFMDTGDHSPGIKWFRLVSN